GGGVGGERPGRLGHPVDVEDLHAQPGEERGHVWWQRGRRAEHRDGLAQAEQAADRPEYLLIGRPELRRQFWRRGLPVLAAVYVAAAARHGRAMAARLPSSGSAASRA